MHSKYYNGMVKGEGADRRVGSGEFAAASTKGDFVTQRLARVPGRFAPLE